MATDNILRILGSKAIPWMMNGREERLVFARPLMDQSMMPFGARIERRLLKGKRIIQKSKRIHGNQRFFIARWPEDNLQELAVPRLVCVIEGEITYLLGKYRMHCVEGNLILMPPRFPHQYEGPYWPDSGPTSRPYVMLQAYGYNRGVRCWITTFRHGQNWHAKIEDYLIIDDSCAAVMKMITEEVKTEREDSPIICAQMLSMLFLLMKREIAAGHFTHPGPKPTSVSSSLSDGDFIAQLRTYLETNCHQRLRQDGVAEYFYMSRSSFARHIRRETGSTFNHLLTAIRLERAKVMLRETDWTSSSIANQLSFKSPGYFRTLFKHKVGCTPDEYRKRKFAGRSVITK